MGTLGDYYACGIQIHLSYRNKWKVMAICSLKGLGEETIFPAQSLTFIHLATYLEKEHYERN